MTILHDNLKWYLLLLHFARFYGFSPKTRLSEAFAEYAEVFESRIFRDLRDFPDLLGFDLSNYPQFAAFPLIEEGVSPRRSTRFGIFLLDSENRIFETRI